MILKNFFLFIKYETGPKRYFDLISCFFFNKIVLLFLKKIDEPSFFIKKYFDLIIKPLQISPFLLNLNLNPLYSSLGGSTIRAVDLTKNPTLVDLR